MEKKEEKIFRDIVKILEQDVPQEALAEGNPTPEQEAIALIKQELDKAREEVQFTKEELECILKWKDACDGEFNGMTLLPASGEDWGKEEDIENAEDKLEEMLSKLKDNK